VDKVACSFPGCEQAVYCKALCAAHYRQRERKLPLHPTLAMLPPTCCIAGCDRRSYNKKRALCQSHYLKWQRGTLDIPLLRPCLNCGEDFTPIRRRNAQNCSKDCAIETARLRSEYGVTGLEVLAMLEAQEHKCAICDGPIFRGVRGDGAGQGGLHIDHCHNGGGVRGLLCSECNRGIGSLKDDPDLLEAAAKYLRPSR
jgi:hypothetical protein